MPSSWEQSLSTGSDRPIQKRDNNFIAAQKLSHNIIFFIIFTILLYSVDTVQVAFPHDNNVAIAAIECHQLILPLAR